MKKRNSGRMTCDATHHLWLRRCVGYQRETISGQYRKAFSVIEAATIQSYRVWSYITFEDFSGGKAAWGISAWKNSRRHWQRGVTWLQRQGLILRSRDRYAINLDPIFRNYMEVLADELFAGPVENAWEMIVPTLDEIKRITLKEIEIQLLEGGFGKSRSDADDTRQDEGIRRGESSGA